MTQTAAVAGAAAAAGKGLKGAKAAKKTKPKKSNGLADVGSTGGIRAINGFDTKINIGKQGKHIVGNNNYMEGRSIFYGSMDDAQHLIDKFAGTGEWISTNKERVDFGKVIGQYINPATNKAVDTTVGIIHYSKTGVHIVPAKPIQ